MRRRRVVRGPGGQNLDSFLDILTNTVGVMVFVLLFVTLAAADASVLVRTPLHTSTEKAAVVFEVRGDRVVYLDDDEADRAIAELYRSLPKVSIYNIRSITQRIYNFEATAGNYQVDVVGSLLSGSLSTRYRIRSEIVGNRIGGLRDPAAEFQQVLSRLQADSAFVSFLVRPDGFGAFRTAREIAIKRGFEYGWEPFEADREIIFGSRGRQLGVQ
jgi:hypothetical protein